MASHCAAIHQVITFEDIIIIIKVYKRININIFMIITLSSFKIHLYKRHLQDAIFQGVHLSHTGAAVLDWISCPLWLISPPPPPPSSSISSCLWPTDKQTNRYTTSLFSGGLAGSLASVLLRSWPEARLKVELQ